MEIEILDIAIEKLNKIKGFECIILRREIQQNKRFVIDAEIEIGYGQYKEKYFVEVKRIIVPEQIPLLLEKVKNNKFLIIAEYISSGAKELLKLEGIPYIDTAGNMFIQNNWIYIYIQTEKTNRNKLKTNTRAFNKAGLKVIYQFLLNPAYINEPYRFIGKKADVTIATVGVVLKSLIKENYLIQVDSRKYMFNDRTKLFEEWVKEYNRNLRPKLKKKRYRWLNKNENWKVLKLPEKTYWGGVNAAEKLTDYLIADKVEIYTGLPFEKVMKALKILPDQSGNITVTETFWENEPSDYDLVDPILAYADLLNDTNPRYLETANKIYREYVQDKL